MIKRIRSLPYFNSIGLYDFTDKEKSLYDYMAYMLCRTQSIFRYENLPVTIPANMLELMLQCNGNVFIAPVEGELYAFTGGLGGEYDAYYRPTVYTVANPALNISKSFSIGNEGILIYNDSMMQGLLPLMSRYSSLLVENDITIQIVDIMSRATSVIAAGDDATKKAAEKYILDLFSGKLGVVGENAFIEGLNIQPYADRSTHIITQLIELQQYLKAGLFNELGINSNYNMKRAQITSTETQMNDDALLPFIDDMLRCRQRAINDINNMFGTEITVELFSAWLIEHETQHLKPGVEPEEETTVDEPEEETTVDEPEEETTVDEPSPQITVDEFIPENSGQPENSENLPGGLDDESEYDTIE